MATTFTLAAVAAIIAYAVHYLHQQRVAARALKAKRSAAARKGAITRARNKAARLAAAQSAAIGTAVDAAVERPAIIPGGVHWPFYADAMDRKGTL